MSGVQAQDKISLMNGQVLEGKVIGQSTLEIRYLVPKRHKMVERSEPTSSVFSVTDSVEQSIFDFFHRRQERLVFHL